MQIRAWAASDVGLKRTKNEDAFLSDPEAGVFVVADGLGAHNAGEVASRMMIEDVQGSVPDLRMLVQTYERRRDEESRKKLLRFLPGIIERANDRIYNDGLKNPSHRGMATTAILFLPTKVDGFICHVGDSRLYLFRANVLYQVTEDHSLVQRMLQRGEITAEQAARHPRKNLVVRCVGFEPTVEVDVLYLDTYPGDLFLLCSDGLSDMVSDVEIGKILASHKGQSAVDTLVEAAKAHGGCDNITLILVEIGYDLSDEPTQTTFRPPVRPRVKFLRDIFLFSNLTDAECAMVNRILYEKRFKAGSRIIMEGAKGSELYVVMEGSVMVYRGNVLLTRIGPSGHFGEMGILSDEPRSASVFAETDTTLLAMRRDDLLGLMAMNPGLGNKILWNFLLNLADRVRDLSARVKN